MLRMSKCTHPWVPDKRGSCFALKGKLPDKSSEDAKHFFGEKKSQVIFCHPLNTQVPRVGEEVLPRQFSLEEQICIVPYMTDVLHFFSYHN